MMRTSVRPIRPPAPATINRMSAIWRPFPVVGGDIPGWPAFGNRRRYGVPDGQRLRIASAPVKLGDGTTLSAQGVKPDIEVKVGLDDERTHLRDAYGVVAKPVVRSSAISNAPAGTNTTNRRLRITEADLVRERREGKSLDEFPPARDRQPLKPQISDPALARAVDLLKGLAVVRRSQP